MLERVPADLDMADRHARSKQVGTVIPDCKELCECCGVQIENEPMGICCSLVDLSFLGPGIPLYFGFVKASMLFFLITSLIYSTFGIIVNGGGSYCLEPTNGLTITDGYCVTTLFNKYSLINISNN